MTGSALRVVLDTNIVVSAVLARDGLESRILRLILSGDFQLYVSPPILNEYAEVLARPKFRFSTTVQQGITLGLQTIATVVDPRLKLRICRDPEDNKFLECADAAGAQYLITGNLRHFPNAWKGTRIVSSRQFLSTRGLNI